MPEKKLAIYLRLSKEADGETEESLSITNQRNVIENYLRNLPELFDMKQEEYRDDGYSGTNIKRPALMQLLEDVQKGKISCIIVKDFSRFMRNHILQGKFLEILFPCIGVRFISVNDHYDSMEKTNDFMLPIKGLTYELYARDMSKKIKSIKQNQAQNGVLKVGSAPYGYKIEQKEGQCYTVDQDVVQVIRRIYSLALEGLKCIDIARILNDDKIPSPGAYKRLKGVNKAAKEQVLWNSQSVRTILRDEVYLGTYVLSKRENTGFEVKMRKRISKDKWHTFPNHHEAIITQAQFNNVQEIRNWHSENTRNKKMERQRNCRVLCGICGYALRKSKRESGIFYYCRTPGLVSECSCMNGRIEEKEIIQILLFVIKFHKKLGKNYSLKLGQLQEKKSIPSQKTRIYEQYKDGKISKEEFLHKNKHGNKGAEDRKKEKNIEIDDILEINRLNSTLIKLLAEKVTVYNAEIIKFTLRYEDVYQKII